jgi:hypothetical protein
MVCTHTPRTMPVSTDWLLMCIHKVVERCLLLHTCLLEQLLLLLLLLQSRNCSSNYLCFFLFKKLRTRLCRTKFLQKFCTFQGGEEEEEKEEEERATSINVGRKKGVLSRHCCNTHLLTGFLYTSFKSRIAGTRQKPPP